MLFSHNGTCLERALEGKRKLESDRFLSFASDLLSACYLMDCLGIQHNDLFNRNFFIDLSGNLVIGDHAFSSCHSFNYEYFMKQSDLKSNYETICEGLNILIKSYSVYDYFYSYFSSNKLIKDNWSSLQLKKNKKANNKFTFNPLIILHGSGKYVLNHNYIPRYSISKKRIRVVGFHSIDQFQYFGIPFLFDTNLCGSTILYIWDSFFEYDNEIVFIIWNPFPDSSNFDTFFKSLFDQIFIHDLDDYRFLTKEHVSSGKVYINQNVAEDSNFATVFPLYNEQLNDQTFFTNANQNIEHEEKTIEQKLVSTVVALNRNDQ